MNGKGSTYRPVDRTKYEQNYDRIFRRTTMDYFEAKALAGNTEDYTESEFLGRVGAIEDVREWHPKCETCGYWKKPVCSYFDWTGAPSQYYCALHTGLDKK